MGKELKKITVIVDVKASLFDPEILTLLAPSVYNPTPERLKHRAEKYTADSIVKAYACKNSEKYIGIVIFKTENGAAKILDIAVRPQYRKKGIDKSLIDFIFNQFSIDTIIAETDNDAIGFYQKCGFTITSVGAVCATERYFCQLHRFDNLRF